jgi:hypothetical protein
MTLIPYIINSIIGISVIWDSVAQDLVMVLEKEKG